MKTYIISYDYSPSGDWEFVSPEMISSLSGKDCVCVVGGSDVRVINLLAHAVENNPSRVYGLAGMRVGITSQNISDCQSVTLYDRRPGKQRFQNNDSGNVLVHLFTAPCYAFNPSKVDCTKALDNFAFSDYLEHAGIQRVVLDTDFWTGPKMQTLRESRINLGSAYYRELRGSYKPIDNTQELISKVSLNPVLERAEYSSDELPEVMVMMTTHNRTDTALQTIESLVAHLKYPRLRWCICDDRSEEGHVGKLADKFAELGVENVKICRTTSTHWGLGASMNNGLKEAYNIGPVVLTTEDDWMLTRDLDITNWVNVLLHNDNAGCIRLGFTWERPGILGFEDYGHGLKKFVSKNGNVAAWTLTNQVALRHRRLYDKCGLYKDNCHPDESEGDMRTRFNKTSGLYVLWPSEFPTNTMSDSRLPFLHFGESTIGHDYDVKDTKPFFRIITPTYNTNDLLIRCARSLDRQTFRDFVWLVVDDCSTDDTPRIIEELAKTRPWIKYKLLDHHVDAGGARNAAAELNDSEYTLYIDSDDVIFDEESIRSVYDVAKRSGADLIRLSRINNGNIDAFVPKTVAELAVLNQGPPQLCHKTALQQGFVENRRKYNDVIWFFRTCDIGKTVSFCEHIFYEYMHDCPYSGHTGKIGSADPRSVAAAYYLIGDILTEKFKHSYIAEAINNVLRRFSATGVVHMSDKHINDALKSVKISAGSDVKKPVVLTLSTPGREWMTDKIFAQNKKMCETNGIPFVVETQLTYTDRPPSWNKIPAILKYLRNYDVVFWIDDDAIILKPFDINGIIGNADVAIAEGNMGLNAGIMAFRNTQPAFRLLNWVNTEGYSKYKNDPNWEQPAVIRYIRNSMNSNSVKILPWGEYNASPRVRKIKEERGYLSESTKILHFAGVKKDTQKDDILNELSRI